MMRDLFSKIMGGVVYLLIGAVIGYFIAGARSRDHKVDQAMSEIKKEFSQYVDKMSKQTQEFEERLKDYLSKDKKENDK
jgi:uncharacterized membrane-anchored protein YhcB (DUF1043 family)